MATQNNMLETQISQVAQQKSTIVASVGRFPSLPQPNPKGHANAITLESGTKLDGSSDNRFIDRTIGRSVKKDLERVVEKAL